ncbi:Utp14-domain-containing protein [Trichoderma citrinoviride]|uniref:Utp14-domain-containing protein n=1 Tax=Trichoderma citrinoviride TaxID=58853 RepID=A0A2T4BI05_9HYPO|nr:Utp14-domain-containing protein [Trichoderma citrinoviride]PTB68901.1 Utp14-domain-containing protein [Trichoderma citrinoviride]
MPGRQAHGRPLLAQPKAKAGPKKSKSRAQANALNAFNIAQERFPTKEKKTPRARELDAEIEKKHSRDEEDEDEEDEEEGPRRKKVKAPKRGAATDGDVEFGSDSEGNEWQLGGMADDDDDSEIESEDAFGDSDNEMFQGYTFRGSKSGKRKQDDDSDDSDDSNDDLGETLGEDAIDLATALDQFEEESEEEPEVEEESEEESEEEDDSDESSASDDDEDDVEDDSDEEADPEKLKQLRGLISGFGGEEEDDEKSKPSSNQQKIDLGDLGLSGLNDPFMKQSVKLLKKESKETRPGATKKLAVPLSRREQGRLDRAVAYQKTNETLDRWTETVKQNRRAEHLIFPLPQNSDSAGLDRSELQPLSLKNAATELESTIMGIMEQSGLSLEKEKKPKKQEFDEEGNLLTRKQVLERKRLEREINSREAKRAKRIKKIKSKAYHRVHRKQRERDEMAAKEAMAEAGEIDSEEEREAQDRRRALERVGQRHKDSKWAKMGSKAKRAVWDDDFRSGLTEMARKDEELRRRKEGKSSRGAGDDSDETSSSGSDSDDDDVAKIRRQLDELEQEDDEPQSRLMKMKFMQKAEAARKKANDDLIQEIRRELDGEEGAQVSDEEEKGGEIGRRQYGTGAANPFSMARDNSSAREAREKRSKEEARKEREEVRFANGDGAPHVANGSVNHAWSTPAEATSSIAGAWSRDDSRRKKSSSARADDLDLNANILTASQPSKPKPKSSSSTTPKKSRPQDDNNDDDTSSESDADSENRLPLAIRDKALVARAFAGEDVVAEFQREKEEIAEADDDKIIDNTLPGWGSWVGEGISAREKKRHQGRFLTKVEGVKKKDRKDAKLDKVIINEKRVKKNDRYLASQLPFPFESRQQYERALRLPVGPEWMTKETFQENTKPRVIIKQGIIKPMSKPTA